MKRLVYSLPLLLLVNLVQTQTAAARSAAAGETAASRAARVRTLLEDLNRIPQDQLNESADPGAGISARLHEEDGPYYDMLRMVSARADVRKSLNPAAKGFVAGILSSRWDCFNLAGNLWLAALTSSNVDWRTRARQQLVNFIQPAHIPVLIGDLKISGPDMLAFEVLQEVTGQTLGPDPKLWAAWWQKGGRHHDLVGLLLNDTRKQLAAAPSVTIDSSVFWYLPDEIPGADIPASKRSSDEQAVIAHWNEGAVGAARQFVGAWEAAKPLLERIIHQPDARVSGFLQSLLADPMRGDYASMILAWRRDTVSLPLLQEAYHQSPTAGRALGCGSLGDKAALQELLDLIAIQKKPLSLGIMDDATRSLADKLRGVGVLPEEQAFELLTHQRFGLVTVDTPKEKKKALRKAKRWLAHNQKQLVLDPKHGYYVLPTKD